jgi:hypothetical protein
LKSDIGLSEFIARNFKTHKLFFTENHPTFSIVAWIGSRIMKLLGLVHEEEDHILLHSGDRLGTWNVWPETRYEFDHYGFQYPLRYANTQCWGGVEWYHGQIAKICDRLCAG